MYTKPIDIALLAQPTYRTVAYLCAFRELGLYPAELIMLAGSLPKQKELQIEARSFNYADLFFDVTLDPLAWCRQAGSRIKLLDDNDINGDSIFAAVKECVSKDILFSASGIVRHHLLSSGKRFIHVHPGKLPDYRGSTCFYYSLLETWDVTSTAFFMNEGLDMGPKITASTFVVNYDILSQQPLFLDHVLDPYIRAYTLKKVLRMLESGQQVDTYPNTSTNLPICYVMHPMLRILTTSKARHEFDHEQPVGIFEKSALQMRGIDSEQ